MSKVSNNINGSRILITGGTGSFGNHVIDKLLAEQQCEEIVVLSRDEKKQHDMRNRLHDHKNITFIIGDVRDKDKVNKVMKGMDYVFHAAALKQVPTCEFFPLEAVKTNILGSSNVLEAAEDNGVKKVVVLSTDKAVYPINAMGMSKALLEKLFLAKARSTKSETVFCGVRYGNVMYSRGSVLPLFMEQIQKKIPLSITHPDMTRYLLPLPVAIDLVLFALEQGQNGDILVRKSPAATVKDTAQAMADIFNHDKGIKDIGIREGEKMHETLVTREELFKAESYDNYYRIQNLSKIDYDKFFIEGQSNNHFPQEGYTSENTTRLTLQQTKELILSLSEIQKVLA
jgi:UDP-N-acetylglucosamine 4,6-dehydratase/5-epimerase